MSGMMYKSALRAEIKELRGKNRTEAFSFFRPLLGKPDDLDLWGEKVDYFHYEPKPDAIVPIQERSNQKDKERRRWGIDYILSYKRNVDDGDGNGNYSLEELNEISLKLEMEFGIDLKSVRIVSYSWYNGENEPIHFE